MSPPAIRAVKAEGLNGGQPGVEDRGGREGTLAGGEGATEGGEGPLQIPGQPDAGSTEQRSSGRANRAIGAGKQETLAGSKSAGSGNSADEQLIILDAPPGTSCPVIETVRGCDLVLLVTEPTPFGLYDLTLAVEMVRILKLPTGVVINRADAGDGGVREYCRGHRVPILAEIPDERAVAEAYSRGRLAMQAVAGFAGRMRELLARIETGITL